MAAPDHKPRILTELETLRKLAPTETAGVFKARQYAAAIKTLTALPGPIRSLEDLPPAAKGDGLGPKIRDKIARIIIDGGLTIAPAARARADALAAFQGIYGVGPKKAEELVEAGYSTIADLRAAVAANPRLLNRNQTTGLQYYEPLLTRIPRVEMDRHAALLVSAKPAALEGVIVGSYRRSRPDSGDIDMLLTCPAGAGTAAAAALTDYVTALRARGYIREVLAHGEHKCLAISALPDAAPRRLDLLITPPEEFPFAVLYFTGSDGFNVAMRSHALDRGFTLNEHALTHLKTGRPVSGFRTERDIFKALGIQWREPHERTGAEALALVASKA
jgi:DNA polymerase/3'-5' exonuclease PolX